MSFYDLCFGTTTWRSNETHNVFLIKVSQCGVCITSLCTSCHSAVYGYGNERCNSFVSSFNSESSTCSLCPAAADEHDISLSSKTSIMYGNFIVTASFDCRKGYNIEPCHVITLLPLLPEDGSTHDWQELAEQTAKSRHDLRDQTLPTGFVLFVDGSSRKN